MLLTEGKASNKLFLCACHKVATTRSISLLSGKLNEPLREAPPGILFGLSKKTANYICIVISHVPDKRLSVF